MKKIVCFFLTVVLSFQCFEILSAFADNAVVVPEVILKLDDLGGGNLEGFQRVYDKVKELGVTAAFGVIGDRIENQRNSVYEKITDWYNNGIEIWHHGYYHSKEEYSTNSYEQQLTDFTKTVSILKEKCGISVATFGSPYNNATDTTIQMINDNFPQITAMLLVRDADKISNCTMLSQLCAIESATGVVMPLADFEKNYNNNQRNACIVLQGHPAGWSDESYQNFEDIVAFLKDKGCNFTTPGEYVNGSLSKADSVLLSDKIFVKVDKQYLDFEDAEPIMEQNRVLVPFRKIFEALGAVVAYDEATDSATANRADIKIQISNNQTNAMVDGKPCILDVPASVKENRFYVPIRFVSESLGATVYWDEANQYVIICNIAYRQQLPVGAIQIQDVSFSDYNFSNDEIGQYSYDGDVSTVWSAEGSNQWICYDLGKEYAVGKTSVMWNKGGERQAIFEISVSEDGENFETIFNGKASGQAVDSFEDFSINANARYVKILCHGNTLSKWNAIKEIYIYRQ